jgi:hypothetical protein
MGEGEVHGQQRVHGQPAQAVEVGAAQVNGRARGLHVPP